MPGLEVEDFYNSDSSDEDEEKHSRLLSSVSQLDSTQRVKPAQRKEAASEVSEYNLVGGVLNRKDLINVKELAEVLGKKTKHGVINKKFKNVVQNSRTLPKPLEKPTEERLKRSIGFENVKKQLRRWDAIVARNALSDQLSFPLNDNSMKMQKSTEFLSQFKVRTPLEEEIAKVLKEDSKKTKEEEEEEVGIEYPLTLEEMLEKRKEMAQLRAKLSYKQTKAQRQSKIKSKKYHRLLKRERLKQQIQEFEILQKSDPEAALKKLSELDKTRAQERASLRHRNTGQWAKNLSVRAKYDVETRKILAEQLKISRDLTEKVSQLDSSDSEEGEEQPLESTVPVQLPTNIAPDNPWTLQVSKDVQDFVSGYKKFWNEKNKEMAGKNSTETSMQANGDRRLEEEKVSVMNAEKMPNSNEGSQTGAETKTPPKKKQSKVSPKRAKTSVSIYPSSGVWVVTPVAETPKWEKTSKRKVEDIDSLFDDLNDKLIQRAVKKAEKIKMTIADMGGKGEKKKNSSDAKFDLSLKNKNAVQRPDMDEGLLEGGAEDNAEATYEPSAKPQINDNVSHPPPTIDPQNFIQIKPKRLRTYLPENVTGDEEALDDEREQQKMMEEAFGDDDVMAEFDEMKREEEKSRKVEIQTALPGWGEWGGSGIVPKRKKKRLLVLKVPPRKDHKRKDVIINENENPNLKNHLVKEVPHPFTSVEAFEANIRAPVGRDWVPETAHQKLIQRSVVTKLGTVIEPMNENEIVSLKKAPKSPYRGKAKKEVK